MLSGQNTAQDPFKFNQRVKETQAEYQIEKLHKRLDEFNQKYNEIKKLRKNKTTKGELELQLAIEELLN